MHHSVRVWDPLVRMLHWALALAAALAWATTLTWHGAHQVAGYAALGLTLARVAWGFVGFGPARFARFIRGPHATWAYARAWRRGHEPRCLGHNPLGAWMIVALLACVFALGISGWPYTTDALWGNAVVDYTHQALAWLLLALIALHVFGVLSTGRRHGENLVAAMFSGRKPARTRRR